MATRASWIPPRAADEQLHEANAPTLSDWLLMAHCPVLVSSAASGFARSAAAAGWGNTLFYVDEEWLVRGGVEGFESFHLGNLAISSHPSAG